MINVDTLLQLTGSGKPDTAALKLIVAQIYQGQIQQLSQGQFRLQLPSPQGALHISLPMSANDALQKLMQNVNAGNLLSQTTKTTLNSDNFSLNPVNTFQQVTNSASLQQLSNNQIAALTQRQLSTLLPQQLTTLTASQLSTLSSSQLSALSAQQLSALQPSQLSLLSPQQLQIVNRSQLSNPQPALAVQVQFQPQSDGRILLNVQQATTAITLPLPAAQLRQLLVAVYNNQVNAGTVQTESKDASSTLVSAKIQTPVTGKLIQLPGLAPLALSSTSVAKLLSAGRLSDSLNVQLQLHSNNQKITADIVLPAIQGQPFTGTVIDKAQQAVLLQQLVKWFNQLQLRSPASIATIADDKSAQSSATVTLQLVAQDKNIVLPLQPKPQVSDESLSLRHLSTLQPNATSLKINLTPSQLSQLQSVSSAPVQLQLQQQGNSYQLQLVPLKTALQLPVIPQDANRPLQFVSLAPGASVTQIAQKVMSNDISQQLVQHAWRHLLPMLPRQTDPLSVLPELPQAAQQILQQVKLSQLDGKKMIPPPQLLAQLQSLLQFQPLQSNANIQTSGGTLAIAIQLLLGQLLQKPQPAASQPANQKLAQLISTLEPAQTSGLLRQLASHSSTLQQSQLATLDSATNQQHILLQLPMQQGDQSVYSQLQLEQREADGKQTGEKQTQWQLTMRFDLQQLGPLLVVAKLQQQQLQLQLYTEQPQAKFLADKFLPILTDRCNMQGLAISAADCTLGKIPDSLLPRANSLLAVKV
ncbi:flagellar hook-length control protein FliK [Rheinheimera baltica]|uniref:Flagellar hook-length control protein FliK n=1 Tax=Rheinheimera baltica TaxID=67576 RepID=A0ABT9HUU5_9GAMM|nr:flagellar hook-length control protein FliK [Rheinheimera baltica]MDP5134897.1 flagellar hook-length control protein FliK [Rheinheimera baltica]